MKRISFLTFIALGLFAFGFATSWADNNYRVSFYIGDQASYSAETNGTLPFAFIVTDLGEKREPMFVNNSGTVVSYVEHTTGGSSYVRWSKGAEAPLTGGRYFTPNCLMADDTVIGTMNQFVGLSYAGSWAPGSSTPTALPLPVGPVVGFDLQSEAYYMTSDGVLLGRYDYIPTGNSRPSLRVFFRTYRDGRAPEFITVDDYSSTGQFTNFDYANGSGNMIAEFFRESDTYSATHTPYYGRNQSQSVPLPFPSNQRSSVNSRGQGALAKYIPGTADYPYGFWERTNPNAMRYLGMLVRTLYGSSDGSEPNFKYARVNEPAQADGRLWLTGRTEAWFQRNPGRYPVDLQRVLASRMVAGSPSYTNFGLSNVSPDGRYFVGLAKVGSINHGLLIQRVDMGIAVDANRDGVVTLPPTDVTQPYGDGTSQAAPYRFWVNDDNDQLADSSQLPLYIEFEQDDRPVNSDADKNCNDTIINGTRDLEDFARLWVNIKEVRSLVIGPNAPYQLGLQWADTNGTSPSIRLFKACEWNGGAKYLFNPTYADLQVDQTNATGAHGISVGGVIGGLAPVPLPSSIYSDLTASDTTLHLLFEGVSAGRGRVKLVILDQNNIVKGEGPSLWLDLEEPNTFVERYTCGDTPLQTVQTVSKSPQSGTFAAPASDAEKDYVLYVHGYNMQEYEKQRWIETTYKRLYWLGFKGRVGGFTWPCSDSAFPYDQSEERAWQSAAQLKQHLVNLKARGYRVHVLGHSQGNVVVGEALRQWAAEGHVKADGTPDSLVATYIASQAAIEAHCYDPAAPLIPGFAGSLSDSGTPNVYANYPLTGRPYLSVNDMVGAASNWVNFENPGDYALTGNSLDPLDPHPGWQIDQRLKPDAGFGYSSGVGFVAIQPDETSLPLNFPNDRMQIFSYVAEGRSLALGSTQSQGVFSGANTDLSIALGYNTEHRYHSGQFRASNATRYQYWIDLLDSAVISHLKPCP